MRPDILNPLFAEIVARRGVGPQLAKGFARLGIGRVRDLLFHLPSGQITRKAVAALDDADVGRHIVVRLTVTQHQTGRSPRSPLRIDAHDDDGNAITIVYFGRAQGIGKRAFPVGESRTVAGRLDRYGDALQMVHPDHVLPAGHKMMTEVELIYPQAEGVSSPRISALINDLWSDIPALDEWIEPGWLASRQWPSWNEALKQVHAGHPASLARDRLAYDEIFAGQLAMLLLRAANRTRHGKAIVGNDRLRSQVRLPFSLTGAQRRAIAEIDGDMAQAAPMLRLLQGDVGSGKTLVAVMALLAAVESGGQGAFLAPTEILARQHYHSLQRLLSNVPVSVAVLTGADKGKAREATLMGLADGSIDIIVGTHAIFQDSVTYRDLRLAVVDEQHKFGVAQRLMLTRKGVVAPHMLSMTATPIPRTLVLAGFGEMEESRLDELPPGRSPVDTRVMSSQRLDEVIAGLSRHLAAGHRAYWVCPLVEESDSSDCAAAEDRADMLRKQFGNQVGLIHGRMKPADRESIMAQFASGTITLLVATTVIEVGVDVPEASLMIIENAERFGLAQLHQLRGRVGRGPAVSACILIRTPTISDTARARLSLMRETGDGFRIAEEDLRLRGGGEVLGTQQSGEAAFHVAAPEQVERLVTAARDDARLLLDRDGGLSSARGEAARVALYLFERDAGVILLRGG